ncbi:hypothetical protein [uncultured Nostoc sp.]|uniref:hypothetical protein n=1 Tax=uncultured Nostoc sp. TaxID=340711 RepID=UPI0035CC5B90
MVKQIRERHKVELELNDIKYQLWRLDDSEYRKLRQNSLDIKDDSNFFRELYFSELSSEDKLNLAELFITLTSLFGDSSDLFDQDRGSFYFPILLVIKKEINTFFSFIRIFDSRGWIYYRISTLFENEADVDKNRIQDEPFEQEFSRQEINNFWSYIYRYIIEYFQSIKLNISVEPFLKRIDSNFILYGYYDNQYFEE